MNRTTVTAADIGGQIVGILERRLAAMRAELGKLGITKSATGTPLTSWQRAEHCCSAR